MNDIDLRRAIESAIINGYRGFRESCNTPQPNQTLVEQAIISSIVIEEDKKQMRDEG